MKSNSMQPDFIRLPCGPPSNVNVVALSDRQLQPGAPTAPEIHRLGLLPSGPDPVHNDLAA